MANSNTPFGLKPVRFKNGQPWNHAVTPYYLPSTYGTAVFIGDAVIRNGESNSTVVRVPGFGEFAVGTLPVVIRATVGDGNRITGAVESFSANPDGLTRVHNPASTERVVMVCDDPNVVFEIQADGAVPAASMGLNAVLIDGTGSSTTGLSGQQLDTTSDVPAADASNQLYILRAVNRADNDTTLAYAKVEVLINQHTENQGTVGTLGI